VCVCVCACAWGAFYSVVVRCREEAYASLGALASDAILEYGGHWRVQPFQSMRESGKFCRVRDVTTVSVMSPCLKERWDCCVL
jgi:hypothetical protein